MSGDPILIPCEGANQPGHEVADGVMICAMCGCIADCFNDLMPDHDRDDILARINRGDFE